MRIVSNKTVKVIKAHSSDDDSSPKIKRVAAYCRVSTDAEEQLKSYNSQVKYFTAKIEENKDWQLVEVYADAGISGVTSLKRPSFMQMIDDCMAGKIDIILTKSISRFSRNVVDTLEYVRKLQKKNVAVIFEDENINTLGMHSELILTVLGSVHEQEIYNISANVKAGLKMKMKRGEMVAGFKTYGYDYDKNNKNLIINEEEAQIVRKIFTWYVDDVKLKEICHRLDRQGILTVKGKNRWDVRTIRNMLTNNKYIGVLEQGKSFIGDPLIGKTILNFGEKDKYVMENHHEAIVPLELFNKAQEKRKNRAIQYGLDKYKGKHRDNATIYTFTKKIKCSCCGKYYSRTLWSGKNSKNKECAVWVRPCNRNIDGGKNCICQNSIFEDTLKKMFVESYNRIYKYNPDFLDEYIKSLGEYLRAPQDKIAKEIKSLEERQSHLLDKHLDDLISVEDFDREYKELKNRRDELIQDLVSKNAQSNVEKRLNEIKALIQKQPAMQTFNPKVFENLVDEIVIGGYDDDGKPLENKITFIYKAGERDELNIDDFFNRRMANLQKNSVEQTSQISEKHGVADTAPQNITYSLGYIKPSAKYSKGTINIPGKVSS